MHNLVARCKLRPMLGMRRDELHSIFAKAGTQAGRSAELRAPGPRRPAAAAGCVRSAVQRIRSKARSPRQARVASAARAVPATPASDALACAMARRARNAPACTRESRCRTSACSCARSSERTVTPRPRDSSHAVSSRTRRFTAKPRPRRRAPAREVRACRETWRWRQTARAGRAARPAARSSVATSVGPNRRARPSRGSRSASPNVRTPAASSVSSAGVVDIEVTERNVVERIDSECAERLDMHRMPRARKGECGDRRRRHAHARSKAARPHRPPRAAQRASRVRRTTADCRRSPPRYAEGGTRLTDGVKPSANVASCASDACSAAMSRGCCTRSGASAYAADSSMSSRNPATRAAPLSAIRRGTCPPLSTTNGRAGLSVGQARAKTSSASEGKQEAAKSTGSDSDGKRKLPILSFREQILRCARDDSAVPCYRGSQIRASDSPSSASSFARSAASFAQKNSSSCGGATGVPASIACACPR